MNSNLKLLQNASQKFYRTVQTPLHLSKGSKFHPEAQNTSVLKLDRL